MESGESIALEKKKVKESLKAENPNISVHRTTSLSSSSPGLSISQKLNEMSKKTSSNIIVLEEKEVTTVMTRDAMRTSKNVTLITWKELEDYLESFIRNREFESEWKVKKFHPNLQAFQLLEVEDAKISDDLFNEAVQPYNWDKNRYKDVVPCI